MEHAATGSARGSSFGDIGVIRVVARTAVCFVRGLRLESAAVGGQTVVGRKRGLGNRYHVRTRTLS